MDSVRLGELETKSGIVIGVAHDHDHIETCHSSAAQSGANQPGADPFALMLRMDGDGSERQS